MTGLMYHFDINDAAKTKIEILADGAFISWTMNALLEENS